ncbi:hypothetical protein OC861_005505 [Tilletia horrida]|nr:hypothetical protein OC861_005505 [Tilletia horrida]
MKVQFAFTAVFLAIASGNAYAATIGDAKAEGNPLISRIVNPGASCIRQCRAIHEPNVNCAEYCSGIGRRAI